MSEIEVFIEVCKEGISIPKYARFGDAGMDVYAAEDVIIQPGATRCVPLGFKIAIPLGYEIQVRPRSGLSLKTPLRIANSSGTIDSGYRDELAVLINNASDTKNYSISMLSLKDNVNYDGVYQIKKGDRIAQIVLQKVPSIKFISIDNVKKVGFNRGGGLGSTGV